MKIKLIDNRGVTLDGKRRHEGYETDVPADLASALIRGGLAREVETPKPTGKTKTTPRVPVSQAV